MSPPHNMLRQTWRSRQVSLAVLLGWNAQHTVLKLGRTSNGRENRAPMMEVMSISGCIQRLYPVEMNDLMRPNNVLQALEVQHRSR